MAEIRDLDWDEQENYWTAITVIEAQDALISLEVANYPWTSGEERRKVFDRYHKLAYPKTHDTQPLSTAEAVKRLNEVLNVQ